jgi:hypothetical protein
MGKLKIATIRTFTSFLIITFIFAGCIDTKGPTKSIVEILNEAISTLDNQSANWRQVLEDTRDELIKNGHTIVSNDVSNMLSRAISDFGVEARCYTDFLGDRVKEDLIRLRAKYTGEKLSLVPVFCVPNPRTVDFALVQAGSVKAIEIDGYNLDAAQIKVYLIDNRNQRTDVTSALANPTRYLITLNLGSNGVRLTTKSNKILFKLSSNEEQSVNIIQPIPQEESDRFTPPASEKLCPDKIGNGDKDFNGHGPDVNASAKLFIKNESELWVRISLHVKETRSDWTEARGTWEYSLWSTPIGDKITEYAPSGQSTAAYKDDNHQLDRPSVEGSGLVQSFEIMGDTDGNDIGNCTNDDVYIQVFFNEVHVKYVEKNPQDGQ